MRESLVDRETIERLFLIAGAVRAGIVDALAAGEPATAARVAVRCGRRRAGHAGRSRGARGGRAGGARGPASGAAQSRRRRGGARPRRSALPSRAPVASPAPPATASPRSPERTLSTPDRNWSAGNCSIKPARRAAGWSSPMSSARANRRLEIRPTVTSRPWSRPWASATPEIIDEIVDRCLVYGGAVRSMVDIGGAVGHVARAVLALRRAGDSLRPPGSHPRRTRVSGRRGTRYRLARGGLHRGAAGGPLRSGLLWQRLPHLRSGHERSGDPRGLLESCRRGAPSPSRTTCGAAARGPLSSPSTCCRRPTRAAYGAKPSCREWLNDAGFAKIEVFDLETAGTQLVLATRPL